MLFHKVKEVAALPDPEGRVLSRIERPNGLIIEKISQPLGLYGVCDDLIGTPNRIYIHRSRHYHGVAVFKLPLYAASFGAPHGNRNLAAIIL